MEQRAKAATFLADSADLIGVAEIAELAGVTKAAVANWRARSSAGFPPPALEQKAGPLYRRAEVEDWLSRRGAKGGNSRRDPNDGELLGIESTLWATADRMRGSIDTSQYRHLVLSLLFIRFLTAIDSRIELPEKCDWASITSVRPDRLARSLDQACAAIAARNPRFAPALELGISEMKIDGRRLAGLVDLLGNVGVDNANEDRDLLGRSYEYFLSRFASQEGRSGGEFYTPGSVVRLMVEMIEPMTGTVYDPCCGSGGMFIQSSRFREAHAGRARLRLYGQELNAATRRAATMNLAMHGIAADLGPREGDTLYDDLHPDLRVDYVLANPPFNISNWGAEELKHDPRWVFGLPPNANANLAWVQHILYHLNQSGRAGIVLANGSLTSDNAAERDIRRGLVDGDYVACMVGLPGQLFYSTTIPVTLWFLDRAKPAHCHGSILFIDGRHLGSKVTRTHRVLSVEDIEAIANTYRRWRSGSPVDGTLATSVRIEDIADADYSLSPTRYVVGERRDGGSVGSVRQIEEQLAALLEEAHRLDSLILRGREA